MNFRDLQTRLIDVARERIRSGVFTERGLASLSDISQPHLHNALKSVRSLSPDMADRLLRALGLGVPELLWHGDGDRFSGFRAVPMMISRIGSGFDPSLSACRGYLPFPSAVVANLVNPVVARLAADLVMPRPFAPDDLLLLDQNPELRRQPGGRTAWIVNESPGLRVRYVRMGGKQLYFANELTLPNPASWTPVLLDGRNILEIIKARIVYASREMEFPPPGSPEPSG